VSERERERDPVTVDEIRNELLGIGTVEIDGNGYVVANRQRIGHVVVSTRVGKFLSRAPMYIEHLVREIDHRDRVVAAKDRRIAELERRLDEVTRTEDEEPTFGEEMADASKEH
jgi:hypothetical protein